jgi:hypothetical protein
MACPEFSCDSGRPAVMLPNLPRMETTGRGKGNIGLIGFGAFTIGLHEFWKYPHDMSRSPAGLRGLPSQAMGVHDGLAAWR